MVNMKTVTVTEFKSHCLQMLEEVRSTGETIEIVKRGKPLATVVPARTDVKYVPGKFKDSIEIVGDIMVDGVDLGIVWEAMQ